MKVFNGNDFLKAHTCKISFSNGKAAMVSEVTDEVLELIDTLGKDEVVEGEVPKSSTAKLRQVLEKMCKFEEGALDDIGMIEAKGAFDFLAESLFSTK